jgi:hypothetical protein
MAFTTNDLENVNDAIGILIKRRYEVIGTISIANATTLTKSATGQYSIGI